VALETRFHLEIAEDVPRVLDEEVALSTAAIPHQCVSPAAGSAAPRW
jgi:hypothetical protein